jgi:hypothetical protein
MITSLLRKSLFLLSLLALPALGACSFTGEMGVATFEMEGGINSWVNGGWKPDEKIAVQTIFSVEAKADEATTPVDLRSGNEEVVALYLASEEPSDGRTGFFEAVGTGRTAIEFFSTTDGEILDFFTVDVAEATSARLVSGALIDSEDAEGPPHLPFGIVEAIPVTLHVRLEDATGDILNHHHVVTASSSDPEAVEAIAGGTVIMLEGIAGSAEVTLGASGQAASTILNVTTLAEQEVTQLDLRELEMDPCRDHKVRLYADLATDDDLPVLGYPVSWSITGGEIDSESGTEAIISYDEDAFVPVTLLAQAGDLSASFVLDAPRVCPSGSSGCSFSEGAASRAFGLLLTLGLLFPLRRRRSG